MYSRVETITPEIAKKYLDKNEKNRNVRWSVVRRYAKDIKNGDWQLSPQGISFYENGNLADGQHRLYAVIMADCSVDILVTYDVPDECTIQDRGVKRSTGDVLRMAGITSMATSTNGISLVNYLFYLANIKDAGDVTVGKFIEENEDMICDAISISSNTTSKMQLGRKAPVMAAIFCALYCGIPKEGLMDFAKVMNSGFTESSGENAAIVLRNYLIQSFENHDQKQRKFAFVVATNAIKDFVNGVPRQKIYKTNTEPAFWKYTKKTALDKYLSK